MCDAKKKRSAVTFLMVGSSTARCLPLAALASDGAKGKRHGARGRAITAQRTSGCRCAGHRHVSRRPHVGKFDLSDCGSRREGCQMDGLDEAVTLIPKGPASPHFLSQESAPCSSLHASPPQRKARCARRTAGPSCARRPHRRRRLFCLSTFAAKRATSRPPKGVFIRDAPPAARRVDAPI